MKRTQGALQSVMGEMGDLMKEAGVDMGGTFFTKQLIQIIVYNYLF
jgi:hypothetical protein